MLYLDTILEVLSSVRPVIPGSASPIAATVENIGPADVVHRCSEGGNRRRGIPPGKAIEMLNRTFPHRKALYRSG